MATQASTLRPAHFEQQVVGTINTLVEKATNLGELEHAVRATWRFVNATDGQLPLDIQKAAATDSVDEFSYRLNLMANESIRTYLLQLGVKCVGKCAPPTPRLQQSFAVAAQLAEELAPVLPNRRSAKHALWSVSSLLALEPSTAAESDDLVHAVAEMIAFFTRTEEAHFDTRHSHRYTESWQCLAAIIGAVAKSSTSYAEVVDGLRTVSELLQAIRAHCDLSPVRFEEFELIVRLVFDILSHARAHGADTTEVVPQLTSVVGAADSRATLEYSRDTSLPRLNLADRILQAAVLPLAKSVQQPDLFLRYCDLLVRFLRHRHYPIELNWREQSISCDEVRDLLDACEAELSRSGDFAIAFVPEITGTEMSGYNNDATGAYEYPVEVIKQRHQISIRRPFPGDHHLVPYSEFVQRQRDWLKRRQAWANAIEQRRRYEFVGWEPTIDGFNNLVAMGAVTVVVLGLLILLYLQFAPDAQIQTGCEAALAVGIPVGVLNIFVYRRLRDGKVPREQVQHEWDDRYVEPVPDREYWVQWPGGK